MTMFTCSTSTELTCTTRLGASGNNWTSCELGSEWQANLGEDVLQPELESSEEEAVSFDGGQTVLAEVEAGQVEGASADEEVLSGSRVHVAGAVKTAQRHAVQLNVTHVNAICRRRRRTTPTTATQMNQPHSHWFHSQIRDNITNLQASRPIRQCKTVKLSN